MKLYKLYVAKPLLVFYLVMFAAWVFAGVIAIVVGAVGKLGTNGPPRAKPYELGFVDVVHNRGTVHLLSQMDGFHEFISTIKSVNPAVEIQGC